MNAIARRPRLRAILVLAALGCLTPPLMAVQWLAVRHRWSLARALPVAFHRLVCRLCRVRRTVEGAPAAGRPLLILANHVSWLDISVLSTLLPVSFVAKSEVAGWPIVGAFARLQRSVFVERGRRAATARVNRAVASRLADGDAIVLFAEGTTSDGNRVLPFRSALVGAASEAMTAAGTDAPVLVQPLAITYTHRDGLPLGRGDRPAIAWYGDMDLAPHLLGILSGGPIGARIIWGEPIAYRPGSDRKGGRARGRDGRAARRRAGRDGARDGRLFSSQPGQAT